MSAAPPPADPCASEPVSEEVRWQLDMLRELGELGMRLARADVAEAEARAAAPPIEGVRNAPDPVLAFSRIARSVRQTVMLHARILNGDLGRPGRAAGGRGPDPARSEEEAAALEDRRVTGRLRRAMTRFIVATAIEAADDREPAERERLFEDLYERLDHEGCDDSDFAEVEIKELAFAICRDLGVDHGPAWWTEAWEFSPPTKAAASTLRPETVRSG